MLLCDMSYVIFFALIPASRLLRIPHTGKPNLVGQMIALLVEASSKGNYKRNRWNSQALAWVDLYSKIKKGSNLKNYCQTVHVHHEYPVISTVRLRLCDDVELLHEEIARRILSSSPLPNPNSSASVTSESPSLTTIEAPLPTPLPPPATSTTAETATSQTPIISTTVWA